MPKCELIISGRHLLNHLKWRRNILKLLLNIDDNLVFTSLSTSIKSYCDNGRMIIKGSVQGSTIKS